MHDLNESGCFPATAIWGGTYAKETTLPIGTWHVMANGRIYHLNITAVSGTAVTGDIGGYDFEDGKWDGTAVAGVLTFIRVVPGVIRQKFTGYLMAFTAEDPQWRMAGVFGKVEEDYVDGDDYIQAGWYATCPREETSIDE